MRFLCLHFSIQKEANAHRHTHWWTFDLCMLKHTLVFGHWASKSSTWMMLTCCVLWHFYLLLQWLCLLCPASSLSVNYIHATELYALLGPSIHLRSYCHSIVDLQTASERPSVQSSERSNIRVIYQQLVKFIYFKWIYYTRKEIYLFVCYVMPLTLAIVCIRVFILDTIPIIAYGKGCLYICCCCYHK